MQKKLQTKNISDFFSNELCNFSCYSTLRMIASAIDGQKNSSRKVVHTLLEKNFNEKKVSVLDTDVQSFTQYLHGSCSGVIQNMGADYVGSNVLTLLKGVGNFGTRFVNEASAPRYIYVKNQPYIKDLFDIRDVLIEQNFEGEKIEPMFFVPVVPLLLINGGLNGLASGFKQHILPRNPIEIIKYLAGKKADLKPFIKGFNGIVEQGEEPNKWNLKGTYTLVKNKAIITEIPPYIEYIKYQNLLDKQEEDGYIKSWKDLSNSKTDTFKFEVILTDKGLKDPIKAMCLERKESEIYNALDENNKVRTFNNIEEILDYFKDVRLRYQAKQKEFDIKELEHQLSLAESKYIFINNIILNKLIINKRKKDDIIPDLKKLNLYDYDNFEYLFRLPVHSFTEETLEKLRLDAEKCKEDLKTLISKTENQLWAENLKKIIKLF